MNRLYISMYHYIRNLSNSRYPNIKGLDIDLFKKQIAYFKNNFNIVTMEQVIDAVEGNMVLPDKSLLLTFDDGYIDHYTYALPILEENNIQGSFFIPAKTYTSHKLLDVNKIHYILASTSINNLVIDLKEKVNFYRGNEFNIPSYNDLWNEYAIDGRFDDKNVIFVKRMLQTALPERLRNKISSELFKKYVGVTEEQLAGELYMTTEQIRTLKRHGMFIGLHGYDHYWLGDIPEKEMMNDIDNALDSLNEFINPNKWVMNYPYGSYNDNVINYIKSKGACIGLTTEVAIAELGRDNPLTLPRFDCNDFPPKSERYKNYEKDN